MILRTRTRTIINALGLYTGSALLIGYFWVNAYSGNHGLKAKEDLIRQQIVLTRELIALRRERIAWQQRVQLLRPASLDPDMLDERARAMLGFVHPRDLVLTK